MGHFYFIIYTFLYFKTQITVIYNGILTIFFLFMLF